jgi:hypothetical protein
MEVKGKKKTILNAAGVSVSASSDCPPLRIDGPQVSPRHKADPSHERVAKKLKSKKAREGTHCTYGALFEPRDVARLGAKRKCSVCTRQRPMGIVVVAEGTRTVIADRYTVGSRSQLNWKDNTRPADGTI